MSVRVLSFRSDVYERPAAPQTRDLAHTSLSLLNRLRDTLLAANRLIAACRATEAKRWNQWNVPPLFFFDRDAQAVWSAERPAAPKFPEPFLQELTPRMPVEAAAWRRLPALLDDALTLLPAAVEVRRMARAIPGLTEAAKELAPTLKGAKELNDLLAVPDDQVVLAIHPAARVGVRVLIRGVADVNQLHTLLAARLCGDPFRRGLLGTAPGPRLVDVYLGADPHPDADVMTARFQLFRRSALRPDGTLPHGFGGSDEWVWGEESPTTFPFENGERVVLLGDPAYPATWEVARKFPRLTAEMSEIEMLSGADVDRWLAARCPSLPRARLARQAA